METQPTNTHWASKPNIPPPDDILHVNTGSAAIMLLPFTRRFRHHPTSSGKLDHMTWLQQGCLSQLADVNPSDAWTHWIEQHHWAFRHPPLKGSVRSGYFYTHCHSSGKWGESVYLCLLSTSTLAAILNQAILVCPLSVDPLFLCSGVLRQVDVMYTQSAYIYISLGIFSVCVCVCHHLKDVQARDIFPAKEPGPWQRETVA